MLIEVALWRKTLFAWKLQANGSVHNMQRCFKTLGLLSSPCMSAAFPGEKQCDPAAQVKGKVYDHIPVGGEAAVPGGG